MTRFIKFVDGKYIPSILRGEILLRSLDYYRLAERAAGNSHFGDHREGTMTTEYNNLVYKPGHEFTMDQKIAEQMGAIKIENNAGNIHINMTHTTSINGYAYCFSKGILRVLIENQNRCAGTQFSYSGSVEILNPFELRDQVRQSFDKTEGLQGNYTFEVDRVHYRSEDRRPTVDTLRGPDPFRKRPQYAYQKEWRVFCRPKPGIVVSGESLPLQISDAQKIFRVIELGDHSKIQNSTNIMDVHAAKDSLMRIYREVNEFLQRENNEYGNSCVNEIISRPFGDSYRQSEMRDAAFNARGDEIAKIYFDSLRELFPDALMDACLRGTQPFSWGLDGYLFSKLGFDYEQR